jgi:uncharacterized protein (TIGR02646 family)
MNNPKQVRHELAKQQGFRCCYCKRTFTKKGSPTGATIEHLKPKMNGGTNARSNLAAACQHCNQHRGMQMNRNKQALQRRLHNSCADSHPSFTAAPLALTISIEPPLPSTS